MPALFTRMSTRPKVSSAVATIFSALPGSLIEAVEAIASPPAFLISLTTVCAGPASVPAPSRLAPMSHTTTRAPSCANNSAMPRPIPRPAPVTIATLPATIFGIAKQPLFQLSPLPLPRTRREGNSTPNLARDIADHAQLRPLLVLGENIAFLGRGEAALRRETKLIEIGETGGLLDAPFDRVFTFQRAVLGRDQSEHRGAAFLQARQRLKAAGARGIVFHEIAVHLDAVEQHLLHGVVAV